MGINRRSFLGGTITAAGAGLAGGSAFAGNELATELAMGNLRGSFSATDDGLRPGAVDDQSRLFQSILERAAASNKPVFLPPGNYVVSNIKFPPNTRLMGVPGATRLVYSGAGHCLMGENCQHLEITGITVDGANRPIEEYASGLIRVSNTRHLVIENCEIIGSAGTGIYVDRSAGRIERNTISGASGSCAIYGVENRAMLISSNKIIDCANGGILVHRWSYGEDGTIVTNNHISSIGAANGGTGQWGNGINVYRANSVQISNNQITDCKLSAIRSNGGSNVQILGNSCRRSGETAIYSEFEFVGAVISNNLVDTCARGISIVNFLQGGRLAVCSNNLVRNVTGTISYETGKTTNSGISVEADTTLSGNVVENAVDFGLSLGWGPYLRNVIATSNIVRGSKVGIRVSVVEGAKSTVISNNIISDYKSGAIIGYRWRDAKTSELAGRLLSGYEHLSISGNQLS
ncbi:MAG: TIGR03808 family TAT-translocated repetitive protein [Hyphomicrobiales bacterium]|nr:TIGR03808 family TAT-translocated repetitive protein [Hyphomicrobiales bacterium]